MNLDGIQLFRPIDPASFPGLAGASPTGAPGASDFSRVLMKSLDALNVEQSQSAGMVDSFMRGQGPEVHTVMLTLEQANLSLELAVQVRNKIVDAYSEIMRMQV